jgi:hypothetical protein
VTYDEMSKAVAAELGLQDIDAYDETAFVGNWLYQGTLDLLSRTRCTVRCVQLHVFADQGQYVLDQNILALVDVENGARRRANRADSDASVPGTIIYPAGSVDCSPVSFVLVRSDVLLVRPTPSVDGDIQVWAVLKPVPMSDPADSPRDENHGAIPEEYHDAIVTYAFWKGSSYSDDASGQEGERYRALYEGADGRGGRLGQIKTLVNKRGTSRAPRRRVLLRPLSRSGSFTG